MSHRLILLLSHAAVSLTACAQTSFSKWIVQSGDSVNVYTLDHMDLERLSNGDLLNCTCRDLVGSFTKCRFVRTTPAGDPVQQWEVSAPYFDINKVIEMSDGSFACFGRLNYAALYLHLAVDGTLLVAKTYDITGIGVTAPWSWHDAVQDPGGRFTLAGEWAGMSWTGMIARIEADGTLITSNAIQVGTAGFTFFRSVARLGNGDHIFCGASNYPGYQPKTYLFRTDSVLTPIWAKAYPDSGYNYTHAKLLVLPGNEFRIMLRETDPNFIRSTLMVAANFLGNPIWARRRLPPSDFPSMTTWAKTAQLVNGNTIVVAGSGSPESFVQVLNTSGDELLLRELDIPSPLVSCPGDGTTDFHLGGANHGPLGNTALSIGITKLDLGLDLCGTIDHSTTSELWFPSVETTWSSTIIPVTVTDELAQFTSYPTTAYPVTICISTPVNEEVGAALTIAPNPGMDLIRISGKAIERVEVLDATGRAMLARSFHGVGNVDLDISSFDRGLYHVRIKTADGWQGSKLVKE